MSRKPRIWYPGAVFHITSRGNRRAAIFHDNQDRHQYLHFLEQTRATFPFHLHAYCLMPNHIHLLLETITDSTAPIMKKINTHYAMYYNSRYELTGHLFQGRYGAKLVKSDDYFLYVSRYIHRNPVAASMVPHPAAYHWSSYTGFLFSKSNPHILTDRIFSHFPPPPSLHYQLFVENEEDINE